MRNSHTCMVLPPLRRLFLVGSSMLYCADIFTDAWVAVDTLFYKRHLGLGTTMMAFVILPLIYANYITLRNRYIRSKWGFNRHHRQHPTEMEVTVFDMDNRVIKSRPFRRSLFPYAWDSIGHAFLNVLCLVQLGVLIDVMEMMCHSPQPLKTIAQQYSHYTYIRRIEVMLENCPQIALQICALIKPDPDVALTWYGGSVGEAADWGDYIRVISLILSVIALPLAICADEEAGRFSEKIEYDLRLKVKVCRVKLPIQLIVLYLGYLLMIVSRIAFIAILYFMCERLGLILRIHEKSPNFASVMIIEAHHIIIFFIYIYYNSREHRNPTVKILEKLPAYHSVISFYIFSFSETFIVLLDFPVRWRRALRIKAKNKDSGNIRYVTFYLFGLLNLVQICVLTGFVYVYRTRLGSTIAWVASFASVACYVVAMATFLFYHSPLLNPEVLKQRHRYKYYNFKNYTEVIKCNTLASHTSFSFPRYRDALNRLRRATSEIVSVNDESQENRTSYVTRLAWSLLPTEENVCPV